MARLGVARRGRVWYLSTMITHEIKTDLPPERIDQIGLAIYEAWVNFALGKTSLGGHRLLHPTGRYAASISFKRTGSASVAIMADESIAPEALTLEVGHGAIDFKTRFPGRTFPMHRGEEGVYGGHGFAPPFRSLRPSIWAQVRDRGKTGFATVPTREGIVKRPELGRSWIIPAMPAYSPAKHLADLIRNQLKAG